MNISCKRKSLIQGNPLYKETHYKGKSTLRVMPCKGKSFSSLPASPVQVLHKVISIVKGKILYREINDLWKSIAKVNPLQSQTP